MHMHMHMAMHRTTILLPEDLRADADAHARRLGISLGELIRRQLKSLARPLKLTKAAKRRDDPVFRYYAEKRTAPGLAELKDGVSNHDKYIAEGLEAEMRRWR
jgi:hypothetical protein